MNRRQVIAATASIIAGSIASTHAIRARNGPSAELDAEDYAAVRFAATAADPIRSASVRVSVWADEAAAEAHRQATIDDAGSDLPEGEFSQSEPVEYPLPDDLSTLPASAMTWHTTAGVAAFRTEWGLLAARRGTLVWDIRIGGAERESVLDLAVTLALDLTSREYAAGSDLARLLPTPGQLPDGMILEERMSPRGTFDAQGSPIPEASPEH